jgi:hypothetical protein
MRIAALAAWSGNRAMKRQLSLAESLRARAFLVRARLEDLDAEALAMHLEEAAERIERLEAQLCAKPMPNLWLH